MSSCEIRERSYLSKAADDGVLRVSSQCHACFQQDVWSRLWCGRALVRSIVCVEKRRAEVREIIAGQEYNASLYVAKRSVENLADERCPVLGEGDGFTPFRRVQSQSPQEIEHQITCLVIAPMNNKHSAFLANS